MKDLTTLAKGKECYLRLHPFCRRDTIYTVLCHFRIGGTGGMGLKPPDVCGAPGCDLCHAVIDGRLKQAIYTETELKAECLRALCQWLEWLWKKEILVAVL